MTAISDLPKYARERLKYKNIYNNLFWYQKNKGFNWIKGQNFGDYLSLIIVGEIIRQRSLGVKKSFLNSNKKILAIGSILHFARNGDVVWGSGVNGKIPTHRHTFTDLDIRMVRGPLTKNFLEKKGIKCGDTFGDPALLLPTLFPKLKKHPLKGKITVIPNLNEIEEIRAKTPETMNFISPLKHWTKIISEILNSELIIASSLHGIIVAEAFNIPVRFIKPIGGETLFKYKDYFKGTGRELKKEPPELKEKISIESGISLSSPEFSMKKMLNAFPQDFFNNKNF
jgi:pyruvyltransferase